MHHHRGYLAALAGDVAARGLAVMYMRGAPGAPSYAYTIGLTPHGHPELLMAGMCVETAHYVLDTLGRDVLAGAWLRPGDTVDGLLEGGYPVALAGPVVPEHDDDYPIRYARELYSEAGPAMQVLIPDLEYRFPWHPGYEMTRQPLLCPSPEPVAIR